MRQKFFFVMGAFMVALVLFFACSKGGGSGYGSNNSGGSNNGGGSSSTPTVSISGSSFGTANLSVKLNTVIQWKNNDPISHTATSDDGSSFDISLPAGTTKTFTCGKAGTFAYHCTIHPGMTATLTVTN